MRNLLLTSLVALYCACLPVDDLAAQTTPRQLVLVSSSESAVTGLSNKETRKVFLAVPTVVDGVRLKPLLNESDPLVSEVFLQKVIFMSKSKYERQLVSRVFRVGGSRPPVFKDIAKLLAELRASPDRITYMWSDQFTPTDGVKSIGVLWEDS